MRLQCNDLPIPVHDRTVSLDRPLDDIIVVLEVDDDNVGVGRVGRVLLSYTDIVIRFEGLTQVSTCAVCEEERLLTHELNPIDFCCFRVSRSSKVGRTRSRAYVDAHRRQLIDCQNHSQAEHGEIFEQ